MIADNNIKHITKIVNNKNIFVSDSPKKTFNFAKKIALTLKNGDVLILNGDLGAGKTIFVKGLAQGLGIAKTITSPTYIIGKTYKSENNKVFFNHIDAYRLRSIDDFETLGLNFDDCITAIEWGDSYKKFFNNNHIIEININKTTSESTRKITIV
jgi:tRNA threonylcarbamoyladenosine biosynthesis protein TsaE